MSTEELIFGIEAEEDWPRLPSPVTLASVVALKEAIFVAEF